MATWRKGSAVFRDQGLERRAQLCELLVVGTGHERHRVRESPGPVFVGCKAGPVRLDAGIRVLKQNLGFGVHRPKNLVLFVDVGQWCQHRLHSRLGRRLAVGPKAAQPSLHCALGEEVLRPPSEGCSRPLSLQFCGIQLRQRQDPTCADTLPVAVARQAVLRERVDAGAHVGVMGLASQAHRNLWRSQQNISEPVQTPIGFEAQT